ncbi:MAG: NapC/NirT family cytochrome c [Acidobacteria bacterium]|nr:NapC/NirT family cytochrome c [Acidobacteriota bacterium]
MFGKLAKGSRTLQLTRNLISFIGMAIVVASLLSIVFLFLTELLGSRESPYLGIFTYIIFPTIMLLGFSIVLVGMLLERRRRRKHGTEEVAYPKLDLNDPRTRRKLLTLLGLTFAFLFVSAFGSYRAFEYTESVTFCGELCHSVMSPEFTAYKASPHARVKCVECHVGPGADWYVRSKLSGAYQLYSVTFKKYSRPIQTPVHNLRPAQDTCEQCHWPEKFHGSQMKIFNHYGYDEKNSLRQTRMLLNTGGGSPETGLASGIHWHMNIANEVSYIATDNHRQNITWVRFKDQQGNITDYTTDDAKLSAEQIEQTPKRRMDCVECHNRPSHIYVAPDHAVNEAFVAGRLDSALPYLKREAVAVLDKPYDTTSEALGAIQTGLNDFYRDHYQEIYANKKASIDAAIVEVQRIFQTYFFPEMKVNWQTHPDNIGHFYSVGCFRCHDGKHKSSTGKIISTDCNICHTVLDQTNGGIAVPIKDGTFRHPVELGNLQGLSCTTCHRGNRAFQHPLNLGDLSAFQCTDCHAGKQHTGGE